jgi:hypothetical protein
MRLLDRLFGRMPTIEELDAQAGALAAEHEVIWREEAPRLPLGLWTAEDYERCTGSAFRGHTWMQSDALQAAITAGHLRDLGIAASSSERPCGLHGDACDLRPTKP